MAVNDELLSQQIARQVDLQRYAGGLSGRLIALLNATERDLRAKLLAATERGLASEKRLRALLASVAEIRRNGYSALSEALDDELREFAGVEAEFQAKLLSTTVPVQWDVITPAPEKVYAAAMARPLQGRLIREWVDELAPSERSRLAQAIRIGVVEGETIPEIVRRVMGSKAANYQDGVLQISRQHAETIVRTAVNHTANVARNEMAKANSGLIKAVQWRSTLDGRTSAICRARDGEQYPPDSGPRPPAHPRCRSTITFVTKSWRELGFDLDEAPPGIRSSMNGAVPRDMTYQEWLKTRPRTFVEDVLGKQKAGLFLDGGLPLSGFVDRVGNELTLDQLRAAHYGGDAYLEALAGGRNAGYLTRYQGSPTRELLKGAKSLQRRIDQHQAWIENPYLHVPRETPAEDIERYVTVKWPSDIRRQSDQKRIMEALAEQRSTDERAP